MNGSGGVCFPGSTVVKVDACDDVFAGELVAMDTQRVLSGEVGQFGLALRAQDDLAGLTGQLERCRVQ
jgi:hypothetical protein